MMDERTLTKAVEPIIDLVLDLEKRVKDIQLIPGEPGKDAEPEAIVELLMEKHLVELTGPAGLKGEDGQDGKDGKDAEPLAIEDVAAVLKADEEFTSGLKAPAPDPEEVAAILAEKYGDQLKGEPAPLIDVNDLAAVIVKDHIDILALRGQDGKDAEVPDVGDIAKSVAGLDEFEETMKSFFTARYEQELEEVTCILEG